VIAVDTNILVYAHRAETAHHVAAVRLLRGLAEGDAPWAIPWPCIYEYLRVVTHARVFDPPSTPEDALENAEALLDSPSLHLLGEGPAHRGALRRALLDGRASGNLVHDAHLAALALEHGVTEFLTVDADFARFRGLSVRNPFRR
jgi:toxin-antitoxin system PIN domain toxin